MHTYVPRPHSATEPSEGAHPEIDKLRLRWLSARHGSAVPLYENVALGSLGGVADRIAIAREVSPGRFRFLRSGPDFERQVGRDLTEADCGLLDPGYRISLGDALRRADPAKRAKRRGRGRGRPAVTPAPVAPDALPR